MTLETTRDDLLLSVIRGNLAYLGDHLREVAQLVTLGRKAGISGGGARIRGMIEARRRWTGPFEYVFQDQSSMLGAAMLGRMYQPGKYGSDALEAPPHGSRVTPPPVPPLVSRAERAHRTAASSLPAHIRLGGKRP